MLPSMNVMGDTRGEGSSLDTIGDPEGLDVRPEHGIAAVERNTEGVEILCWILLQWHFAYRTSESVVMLTLKVADHVYATVARPSRDVYVL